MTHDSPRDRDDDHETFPRQRARTRGFRLGAPRAFRIRTDAHGRTRVVFIRSAGGRTASGDLWFADSSSGFTEHLAVDALQIAREGDIPAAELARRERLREVTEGITGYSLDDSGTYAAFAVDGTAYRATLADGTILPVSAEAAAVDPQISPNGAYVAFVADSRVYVTDFESGSTQCLTPDGSETVTWGLADFIAAEELERFRGMWWLPDSSGLIVERFDESDVAVRWIGDPAQPAREPVPHRYPAAGTPNAAVSLHRISLDGSIVDLEWDRDEFCYLSSVDVTAHGAVIVAALSRDQQRQLIMQLIGDELTPVATRHQEPWITVVAGTPTIAPDGALIEVQALDGVFRLIRDGQPLSPIDMNVEAVLDVSESGVTVLAAQDPTARVIARIDNSGDVRLLTDGSGWCAAAVDGDVLVQVDASLEQVGSQAFIVANSVRTAITSHAESPSIVPRPALHTTGARDLRSAVLLPRQHEPGQRWPVICSPYGGPHAQRVVHAAQAYLTEQWLADQGFAVVITDGRGTPGRGPAWEFAVFEDLAGPVLEDQVDALADLAEIEPALDVTRVGIRGWSFGGYLAALAVLDRPDVFHAAVAGAPVTDWRLYDTAYTERYLGNPSNDDTPYERTSLIRRADQLTRPLLLIHGLADDNVLAAHTLQMSSALLAAGKAHNVLPLSGVTHMTPQEVIAENLLMTEVKFFENHLN